MSKTADSFGKTLFQLKIPNQVIEESKTLFMQNSVLKEALANPSVTKEEKHKVIDSLFLPEIRNFLKVLCDNGSINEFEEVSIAYDKCCLDSKNVLKADLVYAKEPSIEQIEAMKQIIAKKYKKDSVKLEMKQDSSLIGGFLLQIGDEEYDYSVKGRLAQLYKKLAWR